MKIGIIGGGAVGLLFAAYLSAEHDVKVYTRTRNQAEILGKQGLDLYRDGEVMKMTLKAKVIIDGLDEQDLFIIAVKQYHLIELVPMIAELKIPFIFLQNGYSHVPIMTNMASPTVYAGVVEHGALRRGLNAVEHTGIGLTKLAAVKGSGLLLKEDSSFFPYAEETDYKEMLTKKLAVNAVINPLTAILKIENGKLINVPYYHQVFAGYLKEVAGILDLDRASLEEHITQVCQNTYKNRSSMLKDIEKGQRTEIDSITGYLLSVAKEKDKEHSMSSMIYSMVKGMESQGG